MHSAAEGGVGACTEARTVLADLVVKAHLQKVYVVGGVAVVAAARASRSPAAALPERLVACECAVSVARALGVWPLGGGGGSEQALEGTAL